MIQTFEVVITVWYHILILGPRVQYIPSQVLVDLL